MGTAQPHQQRGGSPLPPLRLYNTLTKKKEVFTPLHSDYVRMYNCGPTVYDYAHIGNLRSYIFADVLRRILILNGYKVMQVINITDVGHLTSDADEGDDKMTVALKREGKPLTLDAMKEVADTYTQAFLDDLTALNIKHPSALPRASEHIQADIALIETLIQKEYAYRTADGVYFDTARFKDYGKLGGLCLDKQKEGVRVEKNPEKRNPADFALWKCNECLGWDAPWCRGFPGWHIECSAMAMEYLGKELDIHTGGSDHIGTHHNNEIAQSEAATGKPFARFWMHNAFVNVEGEKLSKSLGNTIQLRQIRAHGYTPLAYRYWVLTGHYRTPLNFSWTALTGAQNTLRKLHRIFVEQLFNARGGSYHNAYTAQFIEAINDDLDTPKAIAVMWSMLRDKHLSPEDMRATLLYFDRALGIGIVSLAKSKKCKIQISVTAKSSVSMSAETFTAIPHEQLPEKVRVRVEAREKSRDEKDWQRADELRSEIEEMGYTLEDTPSGTRVFVAR